MVIALLRLFSLKELNLVQRKKAAIELYCLSPTQYAGAGLSLSEGNAAGWRSNRGRVRRVMFWTMMKAH